jgi:hypothetical protein
MADYYPLVLRAVSGLDNSTGEIRRALYERARTALVNQLRNADPPLDESEITRERLALEEAIRRVEAEADKIARSRAAEAAAAAAVAPEQPATVGDEGLHSFHEVAAEAEELGGAAAEANRSARDVYDAVPRDAGAPPPPPPPPPAHEPFDESDALPPPPPLEDEPEIRMRPRRSYGRLIVVILLVLIVGGAGGAAYWQRDALTSLIAKLRPEPAPAPPQQHAATPAAKPKIVDRIKQNNGATQTANAPAAAVAQKVVLYEEEADNPQGKRYVGSAIWRTETVSPGPGLAPELAVRADVEIPERHMRMTWSLRRNTDKALPASHTIEIMFTLPTNFDQGGIANLPGILMKENEQARGLPLAGLSVKVTDGYFLIGLSAIDSDVKRNLDLLKNRDWFDIPIVYTSGKRAILAMEKGVPGQRAFEEAFRAWGE